MIGLFRRKSVVQNDNWAYWSSYDEEDNFGMIFYDMTYIDKPIRKSGVYERYLKIIVPDNQIVNGNFPNEIAHKKTVKLEDKLINSLERNNVKAKEVVRSLYYKARRMLFEVYDLDAFENIVKKWESTLGEYTLEIVEEKGWELYNEFAPNKYAYQQMGNRQLLEMMIKKGCNPSKKHTIEHGISGEMENLLKVDQVLIENGGVRTSFEQGMLEIAFDEVLDPEQIDDMTYFVMDTAEEFNCKYEGWSTEPVK